MVNTYETKYGQFQDLIKEIKNLDFKNLELLKSKCENLLSLSEKHNHLYGQAFSHLHLAYYSQTLQKYETYKFHEDRSYDIAKKQDFLDILVGCYKLQGLYSHNTGDQISALSSFLDGLEIALQIDDFNNCAILYNNVAEKYYRNSSYEEAETYYLKAYKSLMKLKEERPTHLDKILISLVNVSYERHNLKKMKFWQQQCIKARCDEGSSSGYFKRNEIRLLFMEGKDEEALKKADALVEELKNKKDNNSSNVHLYIYLIDIFSNMKYKENATWCLHELEKLEEQTNKKHQLQIQSAKIQYNNHFHMEDDKVYEKFFELTQDLEKEERRFSYEGLNNIIDLHFSKQVHEEMLEQEKYLQTMIDKDELTGLYNRRYYSKLLSKYTNNKRVNKLCIIMIDVDYFKEYNDTYGHAKGDIILRSIADTLKRHANKDLYVARFGGDEFSCITVNQDTNKIIAFIENVQKDLKNQKIEHKTHKSSDQITLSFGFYNGPIGNNIEKADEALYQAKEQGRNRYCYDEE